MLERGRMTAGNINMVRLQLCPHLSRLLICELWPIRTCTKVNELALSGERTILCEVGHLVPSATVDAFSIAVLINGLVQVWPMMLDCSLE